MVGAALLGWMGPFVLLVVLGIPRLVEVLRIYAAPRPAEAPPDYPIWPLWFVSAAFIHTRRAGALLVVGLLLTAVLPSVRLPWT